MMVSLMEAHQVRILKGVMEMIILKLLEPGPQL